MSYCAKLALHGAALVLIFSGQIFTEELTDAQLLERFLSRSPYIRLMRAGVAVVQAEAEARTRYPNPAATYSREGAGFVEFFQIEQALVLSRRRAYLKEAGSAAVSAADLSSSRILWNLRGELRQAFYRLLAAQERLRILEGSVAELEKVIAILRRREEEGEGSKYDRLRAERELVDARVDVASAGVIVEQERSRITAFFSETDVAPSITAVGSFGPLTAAPPLEKLIARALEKRPDYASEKMQAERYRNEKLAAERLKIPDPVVSAGVKRGEVLPRTEQSYVLSVSIPIPLFNRGRAEVARALSEYERSQHRLEVLAQQIRSEVTAAYMAFETRRTAAESYRREIGERAAELTSIAQLAYHEGERTILELLDVYRVARQGQLRAIEHEAAAKDAAIELERAVGEEVFP